jgi:predicted amidohydrolase YtcJ
MALGEPDGLVLVNGRIWTGTDEVEAVAVRGDRVVAVGRSDEAREVAGARAAVIDLGGRRAIPGLIDSHIHFVRAARAWNDLVRWDDVTSLTEGLERIARAASTSPAGTWIRVLGGWHPSRFDERRAPTKEELDLAAPDRPVYVQLLYEEAFLNTVGLRAAGLEPADPAGTLRGGAAFQKVLGRIPPAAHEAQVASTRAFMAELNRLGVTGVVDPGGFGVFPESYRALFDVWRRQEGTVRVRLYLVPGERGSELEQIREWVRYVHPGFGDGMLRYVGMGEVLAFSCHDMEGVRPFQVTEEAKSELLEISRVLARHGWPAHVHAILDDTIGAVLDVWEEVDREFGLAGRRFSLAHAEPIGEENLERVARLGAGIAVQDRLIFRSADSASLWGNEVAQRSPPLRRMLELRIPMGAGTDATVVTPHNPWRCLWWLVTGESLDGAAARIPEQRLTRAEALLLYTAGSAWFSFEERSRGTLEPGRLADLAVLSDDYFEVPEVDIPNLRSVLTLVDGRVVHAGEVFEGLV